MKSSWVKKLKPNRAKQGLACACLMKQWAEPNSRRWISLWASLSFLLLHVALPNLKVAMQYKKGRSLFCVRARKKKEEEEERPFISSLPKWKWIPCQHLVKTVGNQEKPMNAADLDFEKAFPALTESVKHFPEVSRSHWNFSKPRSVDCVPLKVLKHLNADEFMVCFVLKQNGIARSSGASCSSVLL